MSFPGTNHDGAANDSVLALQLDEPVDQLSLAVALGINDDVPHISHLLTS